MAPQVERNGAPALTRHDLCRATPGIAGLAATMEEEHGPRIGIPPDVGHEVHSLEAVEYDTLGIHAPIVAEAGRVGKTSRRRGPAGSVRIGPRVTVVP